MSVTVNITRRVPDDYTGIIVPAGKTPIRFVFKVEDAETIKGIDKLLKGCDHIVLDFQAEKPNEDGRRLGLLVSRPIAKL